MISSEAEAWACVGADIAGLAGSVLRLSCDGASWYAVLRCVRRYLLLFDWVKLVGILSGLSNAVTRNVTLDEGLRRHRDNFLVLRIIAASLVIYGHAAALAPAVSQADIFMRLGWGSYSGDIAVDVFFLISGFLVTGSYLRTNDPAKFVKSRLLRVVPAYFMNLLLLALVYGAILTTESLGEYYRQREVWSYITTNIRYPLNMVWNLPGVFESGAKRAAINGSQWTLPIEVRMYVLTAILGVLGILRSKKASVLVLFGLLVVGLAWPVYLPSLPGWSRLAGFFAIGMACYVFKDYIRAGWLPAVALVCLAVMTRDLPSYTFTFPLAVAAVVFAVAYTTYHIPVIERFGDPSYGIYLWGWPVQQMVAHYIPAATLAVHVLLSLLGALVLGYASWYLVEKRCLKFKS